MENNFISFKNENDRFFDIFSSYYEQFYGNIAVNKIVDAWFDALLEAGLKKKLSESSQDTLQLLDVGCGPGWYMNAWSEKGFMVYGLDSSSNMIALARNKFQNSNHPVSFFTADIRNIGASIITQYKFDVITSHFNFLNLFPANELQSVFHNIALLAKRGCFWITDCSLPKYLPHSHQENYDIGNNKILTRKGFWNKSLNCFEYTWKLDGEEIKHGERYWFHSLITYRSLSAEAGWELKKCYRSQITNRELTLSPFSDDAEHIVIIFEKV